MLKVNFYDKAEDRFLKFAVIVSRYQGKWVFCKHKMRNTYEIPGGHWEPGEDILATAKRELFEETGAAEFELRPVCVYSVQDESGTEAGNEEETFGMLYFAEIQTFQKLPNFEIESIKLFDGLPEALTYPFIQPFLFEKVRSFVGNS